MRKLYGSFAGIMLAVIMLTGITTPGQSQNFIRYPTLALRNFHVPPGDGLLRVAPPFGGRESYFLVPVWIWNDVDTSFNPNNSPNNPGQHLEPIRSFNFQLWYNEQSVEVDTAPEHGSPIVMYGPSITSQSTSPCPEPQFHPDTALATTFFVTYGDQSLGTSGEHILRIAGAGSVPLPKNASGDTGYTEHNGILLWIRFHIKDGEPAGLNMNLDSIRFNDHAGDTGTSTVGSLDFTHGNMGGGIGVGGPQHRGELSVNWDAGPEFELQPVPNVISDVQGDPETDSLVHDLVYDPTTGAPVQQAILVDDKNTQTELDNVSITSDAGLIGGSPWLTLSCGQNPGSGTASLFLGWDGIDALTPKPTLAGPAQITLWLTVPNAAAMAPGVYYATVTFTSPGADNSPFKLKVRFVREQAPDEPTAGGTGIQLQLTNSCNPQCQNFLTFGTGPGATNGLDVIFGEHPVTQNDVIHAGLVDSCIAYFVPLDPAVQTLLTDSNWVGISRDIRDSVTDTTLIYQVNFNPGNVNCYPVKVCVDTAQFPPGSRVLFSTTLNGGETPTDLRNATLSNGLECVTILDQKINHFYIEYTPGTIANEATFLKKYSWTLVSLPVIPPDPHAGPPNGPIFKYALTLPYDYQSQSSWSQQNTMEFGRGYMIRYGSFIGTDAVVAGIRSATASGVQIAEGWNSVGGTSFPGTFDKTDGTIINLLPLPGGAPPAFQNDLLWEFTPQSGYDMTNFIIPGRGYFIKVDQPGTWNITTPTPHSTIQNTYPSGKVAAHENLVGQLTKAVVTDADGNGQALYFGNASTDIPESHYEMPTNGRSFDARFHTNSGMMSYNHSSYVVDLHASSYPVNMAISNAAGEVTVSDMNGNVLGTTTNGIITISEPVRQIQIAEKQPDAPNMVGYSLSPCSPNPFGLSTMINYSLPQESVVSLIVYNELGQPVQTLVNGVVGAGNHQVMFDGSQLLNGTYYYTLKAGNFVQTERMTMQH